MFLVLSLVVNYMNELFCLIKSILGKIQVKFQYELIYVNVLCDVMLKLELCL